VTVSRLAFWVVALLGSTGLLVGAASATSCGPVIEWNGVRYDGANFERAVRFAGRLGEAVVPPCGEEAGCQADGEKTVAAFRLPGVDPAVAIGSRGALGRREAFLAQGYFPQLPGHPLHAAAYGSDRRPNERAGWRCGAAIEGLIGTVVQRPGWGWVFGVRFEGDRVRRQYDRTAVFVDVQTTITGFDRRGLPHIEQGDRLEATVHECTASGDRYKVVVDRIAPA
jgi:Family of unknown function (DUF6281)